MKAIKFLSIPFAMLALGACNHDGEMAGGNPAPGGETAVSIVLTNGTGGAPTGRADTDDGTPEEREINFLEFFVFDQYGVSDSKTPYLFLDDFAQKTMLHIASGGNVKFVVVANAGSAGIGAVANYAALQEKLALYEFTADESKKNHNARIVPATGFEMSGESTAHIDSGSALNTVTVGLDRVVGKFDAPVFATGNSNFLDLPDEEIKMLWGAGSSVTNADMEFVCKGYALINGMNKSLLMFRKDWDNSGGSTTWDGEWVKWFAENEGSLGLQYLVSNFDGPGNYLNNYSGMHGDSWFLDPAEGEYVYVYENAPKRISGTSGEGYDPKTVYAFIVKGAISVISGASSGATETRYWRINLVKNSEYQIYRNHYYKVTVNSIKTCGYATPEEAEESKPIVPLIDETYVDVFVSVNPWNVIESDTEM